MSNYYEYVVNCELLPSLSPHTLDTFSRRS